MDFTSYIAKGFPGKFDEMLANSAVAGIDREQAQSLIRLCPETETYLYSDYSRDETQYRVGSRPQLESIATALRGKTEKERAKAVMAWVAKNVAHPHLTGYVRPDRGLSEEELIQSGQGWCNEQVRVFIALCEVLNMPARLCFLFHSNNVCGHTAAEVYLRHDKKWCFFDVTFNLTIELPDGTLAEAREVAGPFRTLGHRAYHEPLIRYYARSLPFVEEMPGWNKAQRPDPLAGADLLHNIGLCNYNCRPQV